MIAADPSKEDSNNNCRKNLATYQKLTTKLGKIPKRTQKGSTKSVSNDEKQINVLKTINSSHQN